MTDDTGLLLGGRYRIVRHVAKGGMAEVYLGHDQLLDRAVAVKVLVPGLAQDPSFVERFKREAQAAAGLNHHNVVSVYDFGQDEGSGDEGARGGGAHYIVMEYVDGPTLRDIVHEQGPLPAAQVVEIGAEIAAGLAAAHHEGFLHRDMKSANVLVTKSGNVKVADFGIARAVHSAREGLTMPGAVVGTASYLSPEQAQGQALDARSDVYSLGMVLYEMLAGRTPFTGETAVAMAYKQVNETPPPPSVYNPDVPPSLDDIVLRAVAKDPALRQQSAEALRAELLDVRFGTSSAEPTAAGAGVGAAPAASTSDATAFAGAAAAPSAAVTETAIAGPPTTMMPAPTAAGAGPRVVGPPTGGPPPRPPRRDPGPSPYRRRQVTVVVIVVLIVLAAIVLASLLGGDKKAAVPVTVPSVVGFEVNDAVAEINRVGLKPHTETKDDLEGERDHIAEQDPPGGTTAKAGATVKLFLPPGSSETSITTTPTTKPTTTTEAPTTTDAPTQTTNAPVTTPTTNPPLVTAPPTTSAPVTTVVVPVPTT